MRTDTIAYDWKFEDAEDHEHPYILTVTVAEHTHSEGYDHAIGETEALAKADNLAREMNRSGFIGDSLVPIMLL